MRESLIALCLCCAASHALAEKVRDYFADQQQFELFYEFTYRANVVESFLLECTGDRSVSYKFAFGTAPVSNAYKSAILGMSGIAPDAFTSKPLSKRVWDEVALAVRRNPNVKDDYSEPVLMAQRDVLRLIQTFNNEKNVLCDFVFWEEVIKLEDVTNDLIKDALGRNRSASELAEFESRIKPGVLVLKRLFNANPLKRKP